MFSRRKLLYFGMALTGGAATSALYSSLHDLHRVEFVERELQILDIPSFWQGRTMVQVSDLHIGPRVDDDYILKTLERIDRLKVDIIVYTGDFITLEKDIQSHLARVARRFPRGRHATLGIRAVRVVGTVYCHKGLQKSYS